MTQVITPRISAPGPPRDGDPFRYGWRYVSRTLPDGRPVTERIPLTLKDVLHPQEDDVIPENSVHELERGYLAGVLRARYAKNRRVLVLSDCLIDWGISGLKPTSPDLVLLEGVRTKKGRWSTFRLSKEGGHPLLVIEIVSPSTRQNDVGDKVAEYHRAGVPLYVVVDQEREDSPRRLRVYRHQPHGYIEEPVAPGERVPLGTTGILLGLKDEHVVCYDQPRGKELGDYAKVSQQLRKAERAQRNEAAARQVAERGQREEAAARQAAERAQHEEIAARQAAERSQREEAAARQAAERAQREEAAARQAAEQRIRDLEGQLRRVQENRP